MAPVSSLAVKQLAGAFVLLLVVVTVLSVKLAAKPMGSLFFRTPPPLSEQTPGSTAIQIDLGPGQGGIYFFEDEPAVGDALKQLVPNRIHLFHEQSDLLDWKLRSGDRVVMNFNPPSIRLASMEQRIRMALGMPMDFSSVGVEDLALIPGIGSATARAIIEYRDERGNLQSLSELRNIRGIGDKRYESLQQHLVLDREKGW